MTARFQSKCPTTASSRACDAAYISLTSEDLQRFTPESIRDYVRVLSRIELSLAEAAELVALVRGQKVALARLERFERFDLDNVRPSAVFDPRSPYDPSDQIVTLQ